MIELTLEDCHSIGLALLEKALRAYEMPLHGDSLSIQPPSMLTFSNKGERVEALSNAYKTIINENPAAVEKLALFPSFIFGLPPAESPAKMWKWLQEIQDFASNLNGLEGAGAPDEDVTFKIGPDTDNKKLEVSVDEPSIAVGSIGLALTRELDKMKFISAVMERCREQRRFAALKIPERDTEIALEKAYLLLDEGVRLPRMIAPLRRGGGRLYQTYLSFADPGPGHLKATVQESALLTGTIVHIEWIDRAGVDDKSVVEAYRLPALRSAARVRLHVGDETPCTVFIGRPVFEGMTPGGAMEAGHFQKVLLKSAHTVASTCSSMFALGVVDCKVAMDGMSTSQAVQFMRSVAGNVIREPGVQMLSAAFNINTPLKEDRAGTKDRKIEHDVIIDSVEIAKRAIDLVCEGGFNKVAWDGASNRQPSVSIISQLTMPRLQALVHKAHEQGLETYISAGMESADMRWAVYTGVGGVGIGTSLHEVSLVGKRVGDVVRQRVLDTLEFRDEAAKNIFGQAAAVLARLDWRHAEKSLLPALEEPRQRLHERLQEMMPTFEGQMHEGMVLATAIKEDEAGASKETLKKRRENWAMVENSDPGLESILKAIKDLEEEVEIKSKEYLEALVPPPRQAFGAGDGTIHPLMERARRILAVFDSGQPLASTSPFDAEKLAALREAVRDGRIDVLAAFLRELDGTTSV